MTAPSTRNEGVIGRVAEPVAGDARSEDLLVSGWGPIESPSQRSGHGRELIRRSGKWAARTP